MAAGAAAFGEGLAQENEEDTRQKLRELFADLPQLFRRVNADPDTARAIVCNAGSVAAAAGVPGGYGGQEKRHADGRITRLSVGGEKPEDSPDDGDADESPAKHGAKDSEHARP